MPRRVVRLAARVDQRFRVEEVASRVATKSRRLAGEVDDIGESLSETAFEVKLLRLADRSDHHWRDNVRIGPGRA